MNNAFRNARSTRRKKNEKGGVKGEMLEGNVLGLKGILNHNHPMVWSKSLGWGAPPV